MDQAGSKRVESAEDPERRSLKEEIDNRIRFHDDRFRGIYYRLGLELVSGGYTALGAATFLQEAWIAATADQG